MPTDRGADHQELYRWQLDALVAWLRCGRRGVIEAVTGSGKTDVAIAAIVDALRRGRFVLVLVPSRVLMEQWHGRLRAALPEARIGRLGDAGKDRPASCDVLVATRHSAATHRPVPPGDGGGLLIADECHGLGGGVLRRALLRQYDERLGLTATLERADDAVTDLLLPYFGGICYRYGFEQAIADGVCARPRVAFVGVPPVGRGAGRVHRHRAAPRRRPPPPARRAGHAARRRSATSSPRSPTSPSGDAGARRARRARVPRGVLPAPPDRGPEQRQVRAAGPAGAGHPRRRRLARCSPRRSGAPTTPSTGSTRSWPSSSSPGRRPAASARTILGDLRGRRLDAVAAPRVLDEGIDVPDADLGIVMSASRTRRQMIQRMGRILRRKRPGGRARFVIMFAKDTLEDPAHRIERDGFVEEIERISEATGVFDADRFDELDDFLAAPGPDRRPRARAPRPLRARARHGLERVTAARADGGRTAPADDEVVRALAADVGVETAYAYLLLRPPAPTTSALARGARSAELGRRLPAPGARPGAVPRARARRAARASPSPRSRRTRLSTGQSPLGHRARRGGLAADAAPAAARSSAPVPYRWQVLDQTVTCRCA